MKKKMKDNSKDKRKKDRRKADVNGLTDTSDGYRDV